MSDYTEITKSGSYCVGDSCFGVVKGDRIRVGSNGMVDIKQVGGGRIHSSSSGSSSKHEVKGGGPGSVTVGGSCTVIASGPGAQAAGGNITTSRGFSLFNLWGKEDVTDIVPKNVTVIASGPGAQAAGGNAIQVNWDWPWSELAAEPSVVISKPKGSTLKTVAVVSGIALAIGIGILVTHHFVKQRKKRKTKTKETK